MVTIHFHRIINAYLGRSTKTVLNRIQCLSNFNAAIQIFFCPHKPNSPISIPMSSFASQPLNKYLHLNAMIFFCHVFFRLHLIKKPLKFSASKRYTTKAFYGPLVFQLIEIKYMWQWLSQVFFFVVKVLFFSSAKVIYWSIPSPMFI